MDLNINLEIEDEETTARIKEISAKMKAKQYQPTHEEIWITGYTSHTGTRKHGIFQTKLTDRDREKMLMVKMAIESGELPAGVDDMKKFTKTHATNLYKHLMELRKVDTIRKMIEEIPRNYLLINTFDQFSTLLTDLRNESEIALDTETTGLEHADRICGLSITLPKADYHVYIPVRHTEGQQLPAAYVFEALKPILENPNLRIIMFNSKFDAHMFIKEGIYLGNIYFDGYIAMKILSENEMSYSLKNLSTKYGASFGFEDKSMTYEELFGRGGFQDTPFDYKGGPGIGTIYACKDTHLTYRFYKDFVMKHFARLPKLKDLYFNIERPITDICIDMEQSGLLIDLDFSTQYGNKLRAEIGDLERELEITFGPINLNSPAQLAKVLYEEMGLPDVSRKKKTDAKTLKILAKNNAALKVLLKYRELTKLLTTYIDPLPQLIWPEDKRLHGSFNQVLTATGRFSSSGPNLQNLPAEARKMVRPADGFVIVGSDYSQIEPRLLADLTGDGSLIEAYVQDKDLYIEMAMKVFGFDRKYCEDKAYSPDGSFQPRKAIKSVLLGIMYGMGSKSLSENVGVSIERADQIIDDFFIAYPKVKTWIEDSIKFAEKNEYIETLYNRKRRFPGFRSLAAAYHKVVAKIERMTGEPLPKNIWEAEIPYMVKKEYWEVAGKYAAITRQVVNTRIQGSAADVMKLAMIAAYELCKRKGWKMIATIHDEILFEMPIDVTEPEIEELEQKMKSVVTLSVPMKVDTAFMPERWGVEVSKQKWYGGDAA